MRRELRVLVVASRDDFFAGFVDDFGDHCRLTARLSCADRQRDFRAWLQRFLGLGLAPAVADHIRGIRNDLRMPVLDFPLLVNSVEQYQWMRVDVLEVHDCRLRGPGLCEVIGDATSVMSEHRCTNR
jgi:hypothetical protein